jgi:hypothetical protein
MQTVVVPMEVESFQVICEECLAGAGRNGAVARLVTGTFDGDARTCSTLCPVGHGVEAIRVDQGAVPTTLMEDAA